MTLAKRLCPRVPERSLVIADRGFGTPRTLHEAMQGCAGREVAWLVRVRKNIKVEMVERLADGSTLVDVPVSESNGARRLAATLRLREIRAEASAVTVNATICGGGPACSIRCFTRPMSWSNSTRGLGT